MIAEQPAVKLRRRLHQLAELSGQEKQTAAFVGEYLRDSGASQLIETLGGHGVYAEFGAKDSRPLTILRAELDALPIEDVSHVEYRSMRHGVSHKCGHDGHMAILCSLARLLSEHPPAQGRIGLLFQPAEETGQGAEGVLEDARFKRLKPDLIFALHNLPGFPLGQIVIKEGTFASASSGLIVELEGKTSHAAEPHQGQSPALALSQLITTFSSAPQFHSGLHEAAQVTVVHARLGEPSFGTSPGKAVLMATLRAETDDVLERLMTACKRLARDIVSAHRLTCTLGTTEVFPATVNHPQAVSRLRDAARAAKLPLRELERAFPWSEDFGQFTLRHKGALFGIGAGETQPTLHHPDYDFPDELIQPGVTFFRRLADLIHQAA